MNEIYYCKLWESGRVTIPAKVRKKLSIEEGNPVSIFVRDNIICISKLDRDEILNQCLVSTNGSIQIPSEIRRLLKIKYPSEFVVEINKQFKEVFLIPVI